MTQYGMQRQQAQKRRQLLRPLAATKTPGWEQPQTQRLWRRQQHPRISSGSSTLGRDDVRHGSGGSKQHFWHSGWSEAPSARLPVASGATISKTAHQ